MLGGTDSLTLLVSVVDRVGPERAARIELRAASATQLSHMFVWPAGYGRGYGWGNCFELRLGRLVHGGGVAGPGTVLWSRTGVRSSTTVSGMFDILIPAGAHGRLAVTLPLSHLLR